MVVEGGLHVVEKRSEVKGTGERERHTKLNVEFQRRARRDKKGFLNEQCKEIEEKNRMGKTGDFFKRTRDIKEIFHIRKGTTKEDLTEAEEIKKSWQEQTEELYKTGVKTQVTMMV